MVNLLLGKMAEEKRTGVFWSGGNRAQEDFDNIRDFIKNNLGGDGMLYYDWWTLADIKGIGLDPANKGGTYWRMANRNSKGNSTQEFHSSRHG